MEQRIESKQDYLDLLLHILSLAGEADCIIIYIILSCTYICQQPSSKTKAMAVLQDYRPTCKTRARAVLQDYGHPQE